MKKQKKALDDATKALRGKYKACGCGGTGKKDGDEVIGEVPTSASEASQNQTDVGVDPMPDYGEFHKSLGAWHKSILTGAKGFLGEIGTAVGLTPEQKMMAFHHGMAMGSALEPAPAGEDGPGVEGTKAEPSDLVKNCHARIGGASAFLKAVAVGSEYGDGHRAEAANHFKAIDEVTRFTTPDPSGEPPSGEPPSGEIGEADVKALRADVLARNKKMDELFALLS